VTWHETTLSGTSLQLLENKALSRGVIRKSAPILAEITIRKSQISAHKVAKKNGNFPSQELSVDNAHFL
jgi:hypothetical protein